MIGSQTIRTYSSTQTLVSLSSGEAEYDGIVKGAAAGLGHQAIMSDYGVDLQVRVWSDSSAALGIAKRSGLGRIRHLDTNTLWLQEKVRTGAIEVRKVKGEENPADLFTKHLPSQDKVHALVKLFGCAYRDGRAASGPLLRKMEQSQVNSVSSCELLPHQRAPAEIDELYPRMVAPDEYGDRDLDVVSQAELWVVHV